MRALALALCFTPSLALAAGEVASSESSGNDLPPAPGGVEADPIVNGDDAAAEDYPMAGAVIFDGQVTPGELFPGMPAGDPGPMRTFICSSTLIAPDVVLLAAHCVDETVLSSNGSVSDATFYWTRQLDVSSIDQPSDALPDDAAAAFAAVAHPSWDPSNLEDFSTETQKFDIALLFLEEALDAPFAWLPTADEGALVTTGTAVDVVGWGMQTPIGLMDSFYPPEPGTFGVKQIGASVIADVGAWEFQVGAEPEDVRKCKGDSGGPTFLDVDGEPRVIGVTSRSADYTLCEQLGGYDTRVDAYLDWIEGELEARCEDGSRAWCDETGLPDPERAGEKLAACGCASSAPAPAWGALLGLLALRRRR